MTYSQRWLVTFSLAFGLDALASTGASSLPPLSVQPPNPPNRGVLFVDHQSRGRSGHGNHALTECRNGNIISFYSNTDPDLMDGHSNSGWAEYRISSDGGKTWSPPTPLGFSQDTFEKKLGLHAALVGEAVTAPNGNVIAFIGRYTSHNWHRTTPAYSISKDHGRSWSAPRLVAPNADISQIGREHAAIVHRDTIFVLYDSGSHNSARDGSGHKLYVSRNNGESFEFRSALPFAETAWYGTMNVISGNRLIAYVYRSEDERNIQYATSDDEGKTWSTVKTTFVAKALRNPQLSAELNGIYYLHGRSGQEGEESGNLVLYRSTDGITWDNGIFLNQGPRGDADSYSTNEIIGKYAPGGPKHLLIQSSIAYDGKRKVNLHHWVVGATKP
jgi:Neuraminidase (sialidase)